jgi:hypothetical protein
MVRPLVGNRPVWRELGRHRPPMTGTRALPGVGTFEPSRLLPTAHTIRPSDATEGGTSVSPLARDMTIWLAIVVLALLAIALFQLFVFPDLILKVSAGPEAI